MSYCEINFDGLVGPTHHYAGLASGNLASSRNRAADSNPRAAALEGLAKMKMLLDLGVPQAVLPPLLRPDIATLRRLGFGGTPQQMLDRAWKKAPDLFAACCSASSMWAANAATVAPSCDSGSTLIMAPANLLTNFHRSIETPATTALLRGIFSDAEFFNVRDALPAFGGFADEGAANHLRLGEFDEPGLHVFVYGASQQPGNGPRRFPARQTLAASEAVARLLQLPEQCVLFVQQHPAAIDAGAFHNDVVAVSHHRHLLLHEQAFVNQPQVLHEIRRKMGARPLQIREAKAVDIPLDLAVRTYLFNSQIVTLPDNQTALIVPVESDEDARVRNWVQHQLLDSGFVDHVYVANVQQSMRNGGGPACLRLRVTMSQAQRAALQGKSVLTAERYQSLVNHVSVTYPDQLHLDDLRDWSLCERSMQAVVTLHSLLGLPPPVASI